jgi:hypothetical protein
MTPFLMGLHMTIDDCRPGRYDEGWRLIHAEVESSRESDEEGYDEGINLASRFESDDGTDFGDGVLYELGEWCDRIKEVLSNYQELRNLTNDMV